MTYDQLKQILEEWDVEVPDIERAALYYRYLVNVRQYLHVRVHDPNDNVYIERVDFVKRALESPGLLSELAETLDLFIGGALAKTLVTAMQNNPVWTYRDFFNHSYFGDQYEQQVDAFFNGCPIVHRAMETCCTNFVTNIRTACTRIIGDRPLVEQFFRTEYEGLQLYGLEEITTTGSDFHKGGQQVLIFRFSSEYYRPDHSVCYDSFKVVYKPGDLEIDYMICGKSKPLQDVDPYWNNTHSLAELFNSVVEYNRPGLEDLKVLPTYLIFPRNPCSKYKGSGNLPIRNAYGYLEHLGYEAPSSGKYNYFKLHPGAESDYVLFRFQSTGKIIDDFYRTAGQWIALSFTFSLTDLHMENLRVRKYLPHLIDLENSLVERINSVNDTMLLNGRMGAINAFTNDDPPNCWKVLNRNVAGQSRLLFERKPFKTSENRLRYVTDTTQPVPVKGDALLAGVTNGMQVIRYCAQHDLFDGWFKRIKNVTVRYLAYGTTEMRKLRDRIFIDTFTTFNKALNTDLQTTIRFRIMQEAAFGYREFSENPQLYPNFLVMRENILEGDLINLDVPVFYHRCGSKAIINSIGSSINIPDTITIQATEEEPPVEEQVKLEGGRKTFFPEPPGDWVKENQVLRMRDDGYFYDRLTLLEEDVKRALKAFNITFTGDNVNIGAHAHN